MKFVISFQYMDGEVFRIEVHPDDMDAFMASLGKSEVYFNKYRGVGVWIPMDKVRYFQVERVDEKGKRVTEKYTQQRVTESHTDLPADGGETRQEEGMDKGEGAGSVGHVLSPYRSEP